MSEEVTFRTKFTKRLRRALSLEAHPKRSLWQRFWRSRMLYILLLPTIIGMILFQYYPAITAFVGSFFSWDGRRANFIGLYNYEYFFEDPRLLQSWTNIFQLLLFNIFATLTTPLLTAYLIFRLPSDRHRYIYRVLIVFPMIVPSFVFIVLWRWFFAYNGAINILLRGAGLDELTRAWLGDPGTALYALMFMGFPWVPAITTLIYLAGFMAIPSEIIDAAIVDGATGFRRFWRVELPLIQGQIKVLIILTFIGTLQNFSAPLFMTEGGPGWATMVPGLRMYYAFQQEFEYGYASAIGVVLFVVIFILTLINQRYIQSGEEFVNRGP